MERQTRQRTAILDAIVAAKRPLLPQEVLDAAAQQVPGLGMATVYRGLKALLESGELTLVNLPGQNPRYEASDHQHHHHFQCTQCQQVFDIHACPGNLASMAPPGFRVESHEVVLYGRCKACCSRA